MPAYAYRWADGSVSLCNAEDETEALELLDRISAVSPEALVELDNPILLTVKPDIRRGWVFDEPDPIDGDFANELQEKAYPQYDKQFWEVMEEAPHVDPEEFTNEQCALLQQALQKDIVEAEGIGRLIQAGVKISMAPEKPAEGKTSLSGHEYTEVTFCATSDPDDSQAINLEYPLKEDKYMTTKKKTGQYSVRVMCMFHYQDENEEYTIEGFPTFELAHEYARRFVRSQIEEASRNGNGDRGGLKEGLWRYGQDAMVQGGSKQEKYSGFDEIDFFVQNQASFEECDYKAVLRKAGIKRP